MAVIYHLDLDTLASLFNLDAAYQLLFSTLFGMTIWVSFVGGFIAYSVLRVS